MKNMWKSKWKVRVTAALMAAAMIPSGNTTALAGAAPDGMTNAEETVAGYGVFNTWKNTEWENTLKDDWTQMSLTPGSDETKLNFAWYSKAGEAAPKLKIGVGKKMLNAKTYDAVQTTATLSKDSVQYMSNKVTATGLTANTTYYYSYQVNGKYVTPVKYTTQKTDSFSFIYVGDPQIGSSNSLKGTDTVEFYVAQSAAVANDTFNWNNTLNSALEKTENTASFVLSAGDQIQSTKKKSPNKADWGSEIEYAGYLSPSALDSLPVATTVGNHDADNSNYTYHFNTPNNSDLGSNGVVGGDYWFTYDNALFIMLNTQDTNVTEHKQFIEQAVAANKDCKWRIVTLHQDIYGSAEHSNEPEITNLRYSLVPYFEANDIDVVLTGHDHAYSRSQILAGGTKTTQYTDDEFDDQLDKDIDAGDNAVTATTSPANIKADTTDPAEQTYLAYLNEVMDAKAVQTVKTEADAVVNPTGILYMTANSSSGSKYYDLVARQQTYIAARWQEDVPTYSVVDVTDDTFTINTYRTDNDEKIDVSYTIAKMEVSKEELNKKIDEAKKLAETDYTADSYKAFKAALTAAETVAADSTATNTEVENAMTALIQAKSALVDADKTNYKISSTTVTVKDQKYTGKSLKPSVKVVNSEKKTLKQGTDYTVKYSNNKNVGKATITITGKGSYTGTKTVTFKIVPKAVTLKSVKQASAGKAKVQFTKAKTSVTGYSITYSTSSKFTNAKTKTTKNTSYTLKSLKKGKTYYVKVRAYKKVNGKNYYSAYSKVKSVKVTK